MHRSLFQYPLSKPMHIVWFVSNLVKLASSVTIKTNFTVDCMYYSKTCACLVSVTSKDSWDWENFSRGKSSVEKPEEEADMQIEFKLL
jgi:hypothetical protein